MQQRLAKKAVIIYEFSNGRIKFNEQKIISNWLFNTSINERHEIVEWIL